MKKVKNQIKTAILSMLIIGIGMVFMTSCEEDGTKLDSLVGIYTFAAATLNENVMVSDTVYLASGEDVFIIVAQGMFSDTPCDNVLNSAVELRKSNEIYFVCIGEANELKAGTWSINDDRTSLTLNLSSPPMTQALALELTSLVESAANFSGSLSNLPVPRELFGLPDGLPLLLSIDIQFNKLAI